MLHGLMRAGILALPAALLLLAAAPQAQAQPRGCPPGLAKKDPPCVPPGLAKRGGDRDRDRDRDRDDVVIEIDGRYYRLGERLPTREYVILRDYERRGLPPLRDGNVYLRIDNEVVEAVAATGLLVRTLGAWNDLLN
ncbi:excinuclease ABC subunit A [Halovulum dunhuangense]|uniref:Excinuclease ABC subunit A n=1 Tax=Halovulum dunhuangense TaxID=1505036 RepID=A0A849L5Z1_9RHOB|nr:excinuclease ABC subunit A [Halovulum dunhuangense]NNU81582.1 excinuclease ABC subunit A [Halovulum dunhuangense]